MTRTYTRIPIEEKININQKVDPNIITQIRTYKLITPLFGGGAETQKPDAVTTVRATEVRGHLRFWWRATRGGMFNGSLEDMKKKEEEIWGSAAQKGKLGQKDKVGHSKVKINVKKKESVVSDYQPFIVTKDKNGELVAKARKESIVPTYVAFPLQPPTDELKQVGQKTASVKVGVEFVLEISYPKTLDKEIEPALWAWETFGGIGARTRRGFGALQLTHIDGEEIKPISRSETQKKLLSKLEEYSSAKYKWTKGVPHIADNGKYKFIEKEKDDIEAWRFIVKKLRDFRQLFRDIKNGKPFGRSQWPEPDQIRRETGRFVKPKHIPKHPVEKFPRAKFGLPIVFEFKEADVTAGDPKKTMLQGIKISENKYIERLASPLILRPIACSDGAIGLAYVLEWEKMNPADEEYTPPGGLLLKGERKDYSPLKSNLDPSEATQIPPLNGEPDILQAFLTYLDSQGGTHGN